MGLAMAAGTHLRRHQPQIPAEHEDWFRKATATAIALNAARRRKLQQKRHALTRMQAREDDYLRFAPTCATRSPTVKPRETVRMSRLRIKGNP
jgi:hypothetical protein